MMVQHAPKISLGSLTHLIPAQESHQNYLQFLWVDLAGIQACHSLISPPLLAKLKYFKIVSAFFTNLIKCK